MFFVTYEILFGLYTKWLKLKQCGKSKTKPCCTVVVPLGNFHYGANDTSLHWEVCIVRCYGKVEILFLFSCFILTISWILYLLLRLQQSTALPWKREESPLMLLTHALDKVFISPCKHLVSFQLLYVCRGLGSIKSFHPPCPILVTV